MHIIDRNANLLGAAALGLTDAMIAGATRAAGISPSGAAALVTLSDFPGLGVSELGQRVGLSQPAAARMVDSLEGHGLVRRSARSGRSVAVRLTDKGKQKARQLVGARGRLLADVIGGLDEDDQAVLALLLPKVLRRLYDHIGDAEFICRLCDRATCMAQSACPVGAAERERHRQVIGNGNK